MQRFIVKLDGGREFVIYARTRKQAVQQIIDAGALLVYDGLQRQVPLSSLGHVINAREVP